MSRATVDAKPARARGRRRASATSQTALDIDAGNMAARVEKRLRLHSADFTPRAVAAQALHRLLATSRPPRRILDVCAGAGVYASEARRIAHELGISVHVTAIELREEERRYLEHNADLALIGDWSLALDLEPFDLIVGNPAFPIWPLALPGLLRCLTPGGLICALFHNGLGQRALVSPDEDEGQDFEPFELLDEHPPIAQWRIRGPIRFRSKDQINPKTNKPYGVDIRDYSHWLWAGYPLQGMRHDMRMTSASGLGWFTCDLPRLPSESLRWTVRPGTEGLDP